MKVWVCFNCGLMNPCGGRSKARFDKCPNSMPFEVELPKRYGKTIKNYGAKKVKS